MADVTTNNLNDANETVKSINTGLKQAGEQSKDMLSSISAILDNLLKGVEAFSNVLKEAQKSLGGGIGVTSRGSTNTEQLAKNLASLTKRLQGIDLTKTLKDFTNHSLDTTMIGGSICVLGSQARITSVLTN